MDEENFESELEKHTYNFLDSCIEFGKQDLSRMFLTILRTIMECAFSSSKGKKEIIDLIYYLIHQLLEEVKESYLEHLKEKNNG